MYETSIEIFIDNIHEENISGLFGNYAKLFTNGVISESNPIMILGGIVAEYFKGHDAIKFDVSNQPQIVKDIYMAIESLKKEKLRRINGNN